MVRFLILICIGIVLGYTDIGLLFGFLIALVYCIGCNVIDDRNDKKEEGDC